MREQTRVQTSARRTTRRGQREPSENHHYGMSWIEWSALLALALALMLAMLAAGNTADTSVSAGTQTIRVQASQTLWGIAQAHPVPGNSTAQTVDMIRALNNMNASTLHAEQLLEVPVSEDSLAMAAR